MAAEPNIAGAVDVYVDFNGDGAGPLLDSAGNNYDQLLTLGALENAKVFDPTDNDNTGTLKPS